MATYDSMAMQRLAAATQGGAVEASTTGSPVAVLFYLGTQDSGATVAIAAGGDMAFTTDGTTADTTVATTGTIDLSTPGTYTTCALLQAVINVSPNWELILLGYRPEDGTDNLFAVFTETDVSTAAYKSSGLFLYGDSAVTPYNTCLCISGFMPKVHINKRDINKGDPDVGCYSVLECIQVLCNASGSTGAIYVYSASQTSSSLLWSKSSLTDNTALDFGMPGGFMFRSKDGERLIVTVRNDQSGANDKLRITGYTIDTTNKNPRQGFVLTNALL